MLDFYAALFERSAMQLMRWQLLSTPFTWNGDSIFSMKRYNICTFISSLPSCDWQGDKIREPFRRGLGYTVQWLDGLCVLVEKKVEDALEVSDRILHKRDIPLEKDDRDVIDSECTHLLWQLCPACFGGSTFGRPLEEWVSFTFIYLGYLWLRLNEFVSGGDFQICTDDNFHHQHLVSGGSSIPSHDLKNIIPKSFVDKTGENIARAWKLPAKHRKSHVPDEAIDDCKDAYEAANRDKKMLPLARLAMTTITGCHWYAATIFHYFLPTWILFDTPGEQLKYAIALILWFAKHVPRHSTFSVL